MDGPNENDARRASVVAALAEQQQRDRGRELVPKVPSGWRNNYHSPQWVEYSAGERELRVEYRHLGDDRFSVWLGEEARELSVVSWDPPYLVFEDGGHRQRARVVFDGDRVFVHNDSFAAALHRKPRFPDKSLAIPPGGCIAPMPGKVIELRVAEGDAVEAGQVLLIMEAMKMEHTVTAPHAGTVAAVSVGAGDQVDADALLVIVEQP